MGKNIIEYFDKRCQAENFILYCVNRHYIQGVRLVKTRDCHPTNPNQWKVEINLCSNGYIDAFIKTEKNWVDKC